MFCDYLNIFSDANNCYDVRFRYKPTDATTNPSLLYKAAQLKEYQSLVDEAITFGKSKTDSSKNEQLSIIMDKLAVSFGKEITKIIPGLEVRMIAVALYF